MSLRLAIICMMAGAALTACNKNDSADLSTPAPAPAPGATPGHSGNPQGDIDRPWKSVKLFRSYTGSTACDFVEVRIKKSGEYSATQCDRHWGGTISTQNFVNLEAEVAEALDATKANVCPALMKLDQDYVFLEADPASPEAARSFDPDGACYTGGKTQVRALLTDLQSIRKRVTGYSP